MLNAKEFIEIINKDTKINTNEVTTKKLILELETISNDLEELYNNEPTRDSSFKERSEYLVSIHNYENRLLKLVYNAIGIKQMRLTSILYDYINKVMDKNREILNRQMSYNQL